MVPGISVIICSYNGSKRLAQTLKCLAKQEVPAQIPWEIILVDNASTDGTAKVASEEWAKHEVLNCTFNVLNEQAQGRIHAFKTGFRAAKYEYVLTCDDDNWLCPKYVALGFQIMEADAKIGALGGCGLFEPECPVNPEIENLKSYFVNGSQKWADTEHWVYGAGSIYKKSVLIDLIEAGWQQITTGRKGNSLICGEDVEICLMIYLSGYKVIADDRLEFRHFVPLKRQKISYVIKLSFWLNYANVLLNSYFHITNNDKRPIRSMIKGWYFSSTKTLLKSLIFLALQRLKLWETTPLEKKLSFNAACGTWYGLFQNRKKVIDHHNQITALLARNAQ